MSIKIINPIPKEDLDFIKKEYRKNNFRHLVEIGAGSQGTVYRYKNYAIKDYSFSGAYDGKILEQLQDNDLFPKLYFYNANFMVTEYLEITNAYKYYERNVEVNYTAFDIYEYCYKKDFIPYDIHDENVVITKDDKIKIIDVGCFKKYYGPKHYTVHNMLMTNIDYRNEYIELDNIINHVKRPPIAI